LHYPKELNTIGDHLRKHRLDKKLYQKDVAKTIGVDKTSIYNWEMNRLQPTFWHYPKIIEFLGYLPFEMPSTTGQKIALYRKCKGISHNQFAHQLGIDPSTLSR
jgi:DNA-binding XRE family transcriptional regulator